MRYWHHLLTVLLCLLLMPAVRADEATGIMTRKILLPDGQPAVGATVTFRTISYTQKRLLQEAQVTTDANGVATAEMLYEQSTHPMQRFGYVIVDAPGCALAFAHFQVIRTDAPRSEYVMPPFQLSPAYEETGTVIDAATKAPVAGATVAVLVLGGGPFGGGMPVNIPAAGLLTPALTTVSDANGVIRLRGLVMEADRMGYRFSGKASGSLTARGTIGEKAYSGEIANFTFGSTLPNPIKLVLALTPTVAVSGRVINAETKAPLAGVRVELQGEPGVSLDALPPATTDANGTYSFPAVPAVRKLFAVATHPDFGLDYTQIYPLNGWGGSPKPMTESATAKEIFLRPMTTITGKIIDDATGNAPLTPMTIGATYSEGYNDGSISVGRKGVSTQAAADGTFTLRLPVGYSSGYITGLGYRGTMEFNLTGPQPAPIACSVQRERGFFVRFDTPDPQRLRDVNVQVRKTPEAQPTTVGSAIDPHGYWFLSPYLFGKDPVTEVELRIIRREGEVLPWTKITLDPAAWPLVIPIP